MNNMKKLLILVSVSLALYFSLFGTTWVLSRNDVVAGSENIIKLKGFQSKKGIYYHKITEKKTGCDYLVVETGNVEGGIAVTQILDYRGMPVCSKK